MKRKFDKLYEEMISGVGGVWGSGESVGKGPTVGNEDFYATGDARVPKALGAESRGKKKKGKKIPIFRRNFNIPM